MSKNHKETSVQGITDTGHPEASPASLIEASRLNILDAASLRFEQEGVDLALTLEDGTVFKNVSIMRSFPLSLPEKYLSVRDANQDEIGLIANPEALTSLSRTLVEKALARRYLMPAIIKIFGAKERFGTIDWRVATNRGPVQFTTKNLRESIQRPAQDRIILSDIDENRYDIPDLNQLDRQSIGILYRFL